MLYYILDASGAVRALFPGYKLQPGERWLTQEEIHALDNPLTSGV